MTASDTRDQIVAALEHVSDAFVIYDAQGRLVVCNRNFRELYAYTEDEARPGVHFRELGEIDLKRGNVVVGDEFGDGEAYLSRKAEYRSSLTGSFTVRLRDGRWIKTTDRRMPDGGFVSIQTDITDMKLQELELRRARDEAETANRAKSRFLANMSHELRTPLNAIIGFASMLEQEAYGPHGHPKYGEYAHDIWTAGHHLLGLIEDILDLSRIEMNAIVLKPETVVLAEMSELCRTLLGHKAREAGLELNIAVEPADLAVTGDRRRLEQILVNLVGNSIKFTPRGGRIDVTWRKEPGEVVLSVRDTGIGIEPGLRKLVFEPFRQAAEGADAGKGGVGLGLALVKRFAEMHGGRVRLSSEVGRGTLIEVLLPARD
ncbi:MAG: ATP-binding protein [Pseudomonadota bacterium]|nr:ATP-binding protein [Pseudomonadota bacterium]